MMMKFSTRRTFLKTGATVVAGAGAATLWTPPPLLARTAPKIEPGLSIEDPRIKQLVLAGLDAARSAGAAYADIRLTHLKERSIGGIEKGMWSDQESMTVGIRALVDGYWGFASTPHWSQDAIAAMARSAVSLAKINSAGRPRQVTLAPVAVVQDSHWEMPVAIDPFEVSREEVGDFCTALIKFGQSFPNWRPNPWKCTFVVTQKAFGSTQGSFWTQRVFRTGGDFSWSFGNYPITLSAGLDQYLSVAGEGWERFRDQPLREGIRRLHAELAEDTALPMQPIDAGRFDAVLDAASLVDILNGSIGAATQLDRALGYEANAGGTSYLRDPAAMLGTFKIGAPLLTVTGDRSARGAVNTVQWDDECVSPVRYTIVKNGILDNYATSRESAGWMRELSPTKEFQSSGCSAAPQARDASLTHIPNLIMAPGAERQDFNSLVASQEKGLAVKRTKWTLDFQQLNGFGRGTVFEVKRGKRVALIMGAGFLVRAPEFWNSLQAIGGSESVIRYGTQSVKGEPPQQMYNSVDVAPVAVRGITVVDVMRKA